MIKQVVVCDRCKKNKPVFMIPKAENHEGCFVFCEECAKKYYGIRKVSRKCKVCGKEIHGEQYVADYSTYSRGEYCSILCAIKAFFPGYDECDQPRFFTEEDEKSICEEEG